MGLTVKWNAEISYVLTIYKYVLSILGLWVLDEKIFSRIRWFMSTIIEVFLAIFLTLPTPAIKMVSNVLYEHYVIFDETIAIMKALGFSLSATISLSLEIIRHCRGYEDALDAFLSASSSIISISKLLLHRVNWRHKLILVESIINDWTFVKNTYTRDIMLKYARIGRRGSSVFFYLGYSSCVFLFSSFIFANFVNFDLPWSFEEQIYNKTNEMRMFLAAYCVFGSYTSIAYGFVEVLQILQIIVNCISHCGHDGFFFNLTMHVCGQFEVFRMEFSEIKNNKEFFDRNKLDMMLKRHHRLIYLAYHLQEAFNLVILIQVLLSVILLCVEGFQFIFTLSMHSIYAAMKHLLFIAVLLLQLFLYCFAGQTLELQSQGLASAMYDLPWYNFDLNVMKNLPIIILRSTKPHQLTAGKFLAINFVSFKEILKTSASYLSVLRVMLET